MAGETRLGKETSLPKEAPESPWTYSRETTAGYSYVTGGRTDQRRVDEQDSHGDFVLTSQYRQGPPIRLGVSWQRFSFSATKGTRLPVNR